MNYTPEVEEVAPIIQIAQQSETPAFQKLRVAAYARVSTEQDEQQNSYEAQVQYYTEYIKSNPNWTPTPTLLRERRKKRRRRSAAQ